MKLTVTDLHMLADLMGDFPSDVLYAEVQCEFGTFAIEWDTATSTHVVSGEVET